MIQAWTDGRCVPNPGGICSYGILIVKNGSRIFFEGRYVGQGENYSCNSAEYCGLIAILNFLNSNGLEKEKILIYSDSKLVVNQMMRVWELGNGRYRKYALEAMQKMKGLDVTLNWIPKSQNEICDGLAFEAAQEGVKNNNVSQD